MKNREKNRNKRTNNSRYSYFLSTNEYLKSQLNALFGITIRIINREIRDNNNNRNNNNINDTKSNVKSVIERQRAISRFSIVTCFASIVEKNINNDNFKTSHHQCHPHWYQHRFDDYADGLSRIYKATQISIYKYIRIYTVTCMVWLGVCAR